MRLNRTYEPTHLSAPPPRSLPKSTGHQLQATYMHTLILSILPLSDIFRRLPVHLALLLVRDARKEELGRPLSSESRGDDDVREVGGVDELCTRYQRTIQEGRKVSLLRFGRWVEKKMMVKERRTAFADDLGSDVFHDFLAVRGEGNIRDSSLEDLSAYVSFSSVPRRRKQAATDVSTCERVKGSYQIQSSSLSLSRARAYR
jgi:hypothetical protein